MKRALGTTFLLIIAILILNVTGTLRAATGLSLGEIVSEVKNAAVSAIPTTAPTATPADAATAPAPGIDAARYSAASVTLETLAVKGKGAKTGYSRDEFGAEWSDIDHNGCDTRNDMLARDLTGTTIKDGTKGCVVTAGTLVYEPYLGVANVQFIKGDADHGLDVDHVVALGNVWVSGGSSWDEAKRTQVANDPLNLLMVDPGQNRGKGDRNAAEWLPKNNSFRCTYVSTQIEVKAKYAMSVTEAEKAAMVAELGKCAS